MKVEKGKLSIVVPYCREYPQALFTVQNLHEELRGRANYEIITIDNFTPNAYGCEGENDKTEAALTATVRGNKWLKSLKYNKKLSHWNAKNHGVAASTGEYLFFCDSHVIVGRDSLFDMFDHYKANEEKINGTMHLPLTYKINEYHRLIYKLVPDLAKGWVHYSFTGYRDEPEPYEVPCMSCCGVLMSRKIYDELGGWPSELGIYGGGENFVNFTLSILGKKKWIMPGGFLYHFGEKRGYHWNYDNHLKNKTIAMYMCGGKQFATKFMNNSKGRDTVKKAMLDDVLTKCAPQRQMIKKKQVMSIEEWVGKWSK